MTEQYATDTDEKEEKLKPLEVKVINEKEKPKNPTSEDTQYYDYTMPSDEEIKEMTDAQ